MAVSQAVSPNMSVVVANGTAMIPTGTYPSSYNYYIANNTSGGESVTIGTANTSNPRIDLIVAYVNQSATFTTSPVNSPGTWLLADVQGTPASSPSAPNAAAIQAAVGASNPYFILAQVLVGANVTQILNSNITDQRSMAYPTVMGYHWQSYTPTLTNITVNNGSVSGAFIQIGKTILARAQYTKGSTDTYGSGTYQFSLPAPLSHSPASYELAGNVDVYDGTNIYAGRLQFYTTTTVGMNFLNGSASPAKWAPMTSGSFAPGATGTIFSAVMSYETS
jgi:hypothetical protein